MKQLLQGALKAGAFLLTAFGILLYLFVFGNYAKVCNKACVIQH